jgi:hypothetical protein
MMGGLTPPPRRAPLNVLYYPFIIPTILYDSAEESGLHPSIQYRQYRMC